MFVKLNGEKGGHRMKKPKMYQIKVTNLVWDEIELIRLYFLAITNCGGEWEDEHDAIILKRIYKNEANLLKQFIAHIEKARMEVMEEEE